MSRPGTIVPGEGNDGARWAVVGDRPGEVEALKRRPFVGRTGEVQDGLFERNGMHRRDGYLTHLVKEWMPDNPSPTPGDIKHWGPTLLDEIERVNPKFIIAAGYHSASFFLGESAYLEAVHGIPHRWCDRRGRGHTVIPTYHPAVPFYKPDLLPHLTWDYRRAALTIRGKLAVSTPVDEFPDPDYRESSDTGIKSREFGLDSEGTPGDVFSFQTSSKPGTGKVYLGYIPRIRSGSTVYFHNGMYEIGMAASLGVDLLDPALDLQFFDTMMAAYLLCIEPQSLKMLARRHCGMVMQEYMEVVGEAGLKKQLDYLQNVAEASEKVYPKPEPRLEWENDGSARMYKPQPVQQRAYAILTDYYTEKLDKDGNRCDPLKRWRKCDIQLRRMVESRAGRMPIGTLRDVSRSSAIFYGGRDPDACIRLAPILRQRLEEEGLTELMAMKMRMLPYAAQMRLNGILGERQAFEILASDMHEEMLTISARISRKYFGGHPFNPNSPPQVRTLMRRRGLEGAKKTKSKLVSTSKKSIEHLRFEDDSIEQVEQWRERQKIRDSFCDPTLENWPGDQPFTRIRGDVKITRVTSGRFSTALLDDEPSAPLMAIPTRTELGRKVRHCYLAEPGYELHEADLDQAEMRVMADESGDERLVRLFVEGKVDVHGDTASKIFGVPYDVVMSKEGKMKYRYPAKRAGFGVITGIQAPGLFDQLRMAGCEGWDVDSVDRLIRDWFGLFPGVARYMHWCGDQCRKNGGVIKDRWGMPRHLPNIFSDDKWERLEAQRQSHSHRIQGGAQGWLQNVMGYLHGATARFNTPKLRKVRFIMQVHDSLMHEVHKSVKQEVGAVIVDAMINHGGTKLKVPVGSSGIFGDRWDQLKD